MITVHNQLSDDARGNGRTMRKKCAVIIILPVGWRRAEKIAAATIIPSHFHEVCARAV